MKTAEELNALKEEVKAVNEKLAKLTDEELAQVCDGLVPNYFPKSDVELPGNKKIDEKPTVIKQRPIA